MSSTNDRTAGATESPEVVVLGSSNVDLVVRVQRRPEAGETVSGSDLHRHPGGKGANQAAAAARVGARTILVARVGDDGDGRFATEALAAAGVDTRWVVSDADVPTGTAMILVDTAGDNSIVVSPGANARLGSAQVADAAQVLGSAAVLVAQLEVPLDTVIAAVDTLSPQARLVFNPSPAQPFPETLLTRCDPLVVNEHEARIVLGENAPEEASDQLRALLQRGARSVVITLGGRGCVAAQSADGEAAVEVIEVPGRRVQVADTTGAGDAFTGALAARLATGGSLREALEFATEAGAVAVQHEGAQSAYAAFAEAGVSLPRPR